MIRTLPVWAALFLVVSAGVAAGLWTDRWGASALLQTAAARLEDFPLTVGDWEGQALDLDARQLEVGEIAGYAMRRYVHRRTGNSVSVLIVCGRPGPISVHTPDVCYRGAGYEQAAQQTKQSVELGSPPPAELWVGNFTKPDPATPDHLRIFWSWSADGSWQAPEGDPRFAFARYPALYKFYLVRPMTTPDEPLKNDPALDFLRLLLPRLRTSLFPTA